LHLTPLHKASEAKCWMRPDGRIQPDENLDCAIACYWFQRLYKN
jgi:hypothetical protein